MPVLTDQQIANSAVAGGFTGDQIPVAVAVALAESRGNSDATHRNVNGTTDYGLWQINSVHFRPGGLLAGRTGESLFVSTANAEAARVVFGAQGWRAWSTYKSGAYLLFLPRGRAVAQTASSEVSGRSATETENPLTSLSDAASGLVSAGEWLSSARNWLRIAQVAVGVGIVLVGINMLVIKNPSVQKTVRGLKP